MGEARRCRDAHGLAVLYERPVGGKHGSLMLELDEAMWGDKSRDRYVVTDWNVIIPKLI
jgi:hypothetical protein